MSLLKVTTIHNVNVHSYISMKVDSVLFTNYCRVREAGYNVRSWAASMYQRAREYIGQSRGDTKGTRLWTHHFIMVNQYLYKNNFKANASKVFIEAYMQLKKVQIDLIFFVLIMYASKLHIVYIHVYIFLREKSVITQYSC